MTLPPRPECFALYSWFAEKSVHVVHPEDLERFIASHPPGRVFGYTRAGDWITLSSGVDEFRVRGELLEPVPPPRYWIGEAVTFHSRGAKRRGVVRLVAWHFKDRRPFCLLTFQDKELSKRYQESDLSKHS